MIPRLHKTFPIFDPDKPAGKAMSFITEITNGGIWVHPEGAGPNSSGQAVSTTSGWHIADAIEMFLQGTKYIWMGLESGVAKLVLGRADKSHAVISQNGMDIYGSSSSSSAIAHLGFETANGEATTSDMPYCRFGKKMSTAAAFDPTVSYKVGDFCTHDGDIYVCNTANSSPEIWIASHWSKVLQGGFSVAEGDSCVAYGIGSHAQGCFSLAKGAWSHAEGYNTKAIGPDSHTEGILTRAEGAYSHAQNFQTKTDYAYQTAIGKFNDNKSGNLFEIGNGSSDSSRSNAFEVDANGNVVAAGSLATSGDDSSWQTLANTSSTIKYRKHHGVVYVVGEASNSISVGTGGTLVGTLPTGYRPSIDVSGALSTTTANPGQFTIATDGGITLWNFGGTGKYWRFTVSYPA